MTTIEEMTYITKDDTARRRVRRFVAYSALFLAALVVLRLIVVPACKDIYTDYGAELPSATRLTLSLLEGSGLIFIILSALATAAVARILSRTPPDSAFRRYAWLIPAAGLAIVFVLVFTLVYPVFTVPYKPSPRYGIV